MLRYKSASYACATIVPFSTTMLAPPSMALAINASSIKTDWLASVVVVCMRATHPWQVGPTT